MPINKLDFFHEGTLRICGNLDISEVMQSTLVFLRQYMPANTIMLNIYEPDTKSVRIISFASDRLTNITDAPFPVSLESQGFIEGAEEKVLTTNPSQNESLVREINSVIGVENSSCIIMQLEDQGHRLGVVMVIAEPPQPYTQRHQKLFSLLEVPFTIAMSNTLRYREIQRLEGMLRDDNRFLSQELHRMSGDEIIGKNGGLKEVMAMVNLVAPLGSNVLLMGESGVGKEIIANAIHYSSGRSNGPLVKVNCGAIPEYLLDSELFGHEKGAFTGALTQHRGRFERAHGGTLFLDEIGELPPPAQVRLLRVLQDKKIERVGGSRPVQVDVRVVAATNRDLKSMVDRGEFREDLWFRLNVFPITLPLRQRKEDIPALADYFIHRKSKEMKLPHLAGLDHSLLANLQTYDWPGNVRELENVIERELIKKQRPQSERPLFTDIVNPALSDAAIDASGAIAARDMSHPQPLDTMIQSHIQSVLTRTKGKVQGANGAAALLGMHPSTLRYKMRKLGIPFGRGNWGR